MRSLTSRGRRGRFAVPPRPSRRPGADRGDGVVEFVIVTPVMLLLTFMVVQAGVYFYAQSLALAAATVGVNTARQNGGQEEAGEAAAEEFLGQTPAMLVGANVTAMVDPDPALDDVMRVTVTADVFSVFPGLEFTVTETARRPIERFVP